MERDARRLAYASNSIVVCCPEVQISAGCSLFFVAMSAVVNNP